MTEPEASQQSPSMAGWYPDPHNPQNQRYWDGSAWTAASLPKEPTSGLTPNGARHRKRARLLIILGVVGVLSAIMAIIMVQTVAGPILREQAAIAADTQAKLDASMLGRDLAMYFIDHTGAPPQITVVDGEYRIAGASPPYDVEAVGADVELGGVTGTGSFDWCVWVTHPDGEYQEFRYSAVGGLEQGRC